MHLALIALCFPYTMWDNLSFSSFFLLLYFILCHVTNTDAVATFIHYVILFVCLKWPGFVSQFPSFLPYPNPGLLFQGALTPLFLITPTYSLINYMHIRQPSSVHPLCLFCSPPTLDYVHCGMLLQSFHLINLQKTLWLQLPSPTNVYPAYDTSYIHAVCQPSYL